MKLKWKISLTIRSLFEDPIYKLQIRISADPQVNNVALDYI
jgi:hypothetical protein